MPWALGVALLGQEPDWARTQTLLMRVKPAWVQMQTPWLLGVEFRGQVVVLLPPPLLLLALAFQVHILFEIMKLGSLQTQTPFMREAP